MHFFLALNAKVIDSLRVFISTVEQGSFSGAPRILGLSASSVSRQIDNLEQELQAKLFKRSPPNSDPHQCW